MAGLTKSEAVQRFQAAIVDTLNAVGWTVVGSTWTPVTESPLPDADVEKMLMDVAGVDVAVCGLCRRERTIYDAYDYNPLQVVTGRDLGWYSGEDGELCPKCMATMLGRQ